MDWIVGTGTFIIIWWLILFLVLPFGIQTGNDAVVGLPTGAPVKTRLKLKFAITTAVSAVLWLILYLVDFFGLVNIFA